MASDHSDTIKVKPEELYDQSEGGFAGAPVAHVDEVQEVEPNEKQKDVLKHEEEAQQASVAEKQSEPVTHETDQLKTTYTTEDVPNPSLKEKIKGKLVNLGDKLRPKDVVEAKQDDPHPGLM